MHLADLQGAIQAYVLNSAPLAQPLVRGTPQFDVPARLDVYRHAFRERLIGALAVNYPALQRALGEQQFRHLTHAYIAAHPPQHFSVRYFGRELAQFIAARGGVRNHGLSELARWEWTLATAFDAADRTSMTSDALAGVAPEDWERLRFEFAPSLQRLALTSNAVRWWRAMTEDAQRPSRWRMATRVEWVVWRNDLKTYFRSLDASEAAAIDAALQGQSFGRICEVLAEFPADQDPAVRAALMLQTWFHEGWIVGVATEA